MDKERLYERNIEAMAMLKKAEAKIRDLNGQLARTHSDLNATMAEAEKLRCQNAELRVKVIDLEEALSRIAYPIWWGKEDAIREGCQVDGRMLVALSNDPEYLKGIAKKVCPELPKTSTEPQ